MSWGDRLTILAAAGTIAATVSVGTCSTNSRFASVENRLDSMSGQIETLGDRVSNLGERVATIEGKLDVLIAQSGAPSDD